MSHPTLITIVDGALPVNKLDYIALEGAAFYAIRHPTRRHLYDIIKDRTGSPRNGRLVTAKTLARRVNEILSLVS